MRGKIAGLLGEDPFARRGGPEVHVAVSTQGEGLAAQVRLRESAGAPETTRRFDSPSGDCGALTDAVALAVTLALTETRPPAPPASTLQNAPPANENPAPPVFVDRGTLPEMKRDVRRPWTAAAEVLWTLGALPKAQAGIGLEVRYALAPRFGLAIGGDYLPPASEAGQFSVSLARGKLAACAVPFAHGSFSLSGCASAEAGALQIGNELSTLRTAGAHPWFGVGLMARAAARVASQWVVEGAAGTLVPTTRSVYATPSCPLIGFQEPAATLSVVISTGVLF